MKNQNNHKGISLPEFIAILTLLGFTVFIVAFVVMSIANSIGKNPFIN